MATLTFAFRVGASGWISRAIRFVTKSQQGISHVEVILPDGRSFSSREPDGASWANIDYSAEPGGWLFVDMVDVPKNFIENAVEWCDSKAGTGYDFLGIARFYLVKRRLNQRLFCSEAATEIARICGRFEELDPALTSPQRLYDALVADYHARRAKG